MGNIFDGMARWFANPNYCSLPKNATSFGAQTPVDISPTDIGSTIAFSVRDIVVGTTTTTQYKIWRSSSTPSWSDTPLWTSSTGIRPVAELYEQAGIASGTQKLWLAVNDAATLTVDVKYVRF